MNKLIKFLAFYFFRITYILFISNLVLEGILKYFYYDFISQTEIFNYLFWLFFGLMLGSFVTIQSVKYLNKE